MPTRVAPGVIVAAILLALSSQPLRAGGPLIVGGPNFGSPGQPILWPAGAPIQYRIDGGPLSKTPASSGGTVILDNAAGIARVQAMFNTWQAVPTANLSFANIGSIQPVGAFAGDDVQTAQDFDAVEGSCGGGTQSPIVFDADGTIINQLIGDPNVIGFAEVCKVDAATGHIVSAAALLNGAYQDGMDTPWDHEISAAQFDQAFVHEFGHFIGLDHSQVNISVLKQTPDQCNTDTIAGLPVMFPILYCQARVSVGLPALAPDDIAWISYLYPVPATPAPPAGKQAFSAVYGFIQGNVYFSDGITPVQDVNVVAAQSTQIGFSSVSGYQFTGNYGQSVTCTDPANPTTATCKNLGGDKSGSRDPRLIGTYMIPVTAGTYTVSVESVDSDFVGGSGLNPLTWPIPMPGSAAPATAVQVTPGATVTVNFTLQGTPARFDSFETSQLWGEPLPRGSRHDGAELGR